MRLGVISESRRFQAGVVDLVHNTLLRQRAVADSMSQFLGCQILLCADCLLMQEKARGLVMKLGLSVAVTSLLSLPHRLVKKVHKDALLSMRDFWVSGWSSSTDWLYFKRRRAS